MDKGILGCCELDTIADELEESEVITAKIITCKQKTDEIMSVVTPVTSASPSPHGTYFIVTSCCGGKTLTS